MNQEEILIQGESTRTTIKYFTTFSGQTSDDDLVYYLITDSTNNPLKLVQSDLKEVEDVESEQVTGKVQRDLLEYDPPFESAKIKRVGEEEFDEDEDKDENFDDDNEFGL